MWLMPECPYCGKNETGEIRPTETFSVKSEINIKRINAKKGIRIYYTDVDNYKFLKSCNANYYCFLCDRPFHGEALQYYPDDPEEKEKYLKESGINKELESFNRKVKRPSKGFIKGMIGKFFK